MTVEVTAAASRPRDVVAGNIRAEMARQGLSQVALAALLGWSPRQVQRRVRAEDELNIEDIVLIARALVVPPSVLLSGLDDIDTGE